MRSDLIKKGFERAPHRSLLKATGVIKSDDDFKKPCIGVCNSYIDLIPGHVHLQEFGRIVKEAIREAGGVPFEFNTIGVDDGIAMGHLGMRYSLPSRELIADSFETVVEAHRLDGVICIPNCDKIVPGMIMGAVRVNVPTIFVSGGPMKSGRTPDGEKIDLISVFEGVGQFKAGSINEKKLKELEDFACPTCGSCSGMFTANSMNCLMEALGLALPGNGTMVATHADRKRLFAEAGQRVVDLARRYYEQDESGILPRGIATFDAFENAMTLDIAMGGSTNTVLHLLAAAHEAEVPFTMRDMDRLSRRVPNLCKVAPSSPDVHVEDVHRAGGVFAILAELDRGGLLHRSAHTVHAATLGAAIDHWDVQGGEDEDVREFYRAAPGGIRTTEPFSQRRRYECLDLDRAQGAIRDVAHAFSQDGGLAVLYGNIATDGCIVKTAGVDPASLAFTGPARIFESQDDAVEGILGGRVQPGEVVVIRYEGPKGGPGMQEMLYPTSYLKSKGLGKACALVTDGRFSGGSSGLSIGHVSPEAAEGGTIGLVEADDRIEIDIPARSIKLVVSDEELARRRAAMQQKGADAWKPAKPRKRNVTTALKA